MSFFSINIISISSLSTWVYLRGDILNVANTLETFYVKYFFSIKILNCFSVIKGGDSTHTKKINIVGFRLTGFPSFEHLLVFLQSPISYLFTKNISFLTIFWILLKLHKNTCNGTFKKAMASQNLFPKYLLQLLSKMLQNYPQMRICLRCLKRPSLQKGEIINKKE